MSEEVKNSAAEASTEKRGSRKTRIGKVTSNKADKTITVAFEIKVKHPIYKKFFKKTTKFVARID